MHIASGRSLQLLQKENIFLFLWTRQNELPRRRQYRLLLLTPLQIISNNITLEASAADLAFSRPIHPAAVLRLVIGSAVHHTAVALGLLAKGHTDKEAEPINCVSSRGSTQQTSIVKLQCDVGAFSQEPQKTWDYWDFTDSIVIVTDIKILQGVWNICATNLQNKATILQLHFTRLDKECLIRENRLNVHSLIGSTFYPHFWVLLHHSGWQVWLSMWSG